MKYLKFVKVAAGAAIFCSFLGGSNSVSAAPAAELMIEEAVPLVQQIVVLTINTNNCTLINSTMQPPACYVDVSERALGLPEGGIIIDKLYGDSVEDNRVTVVFDDGLVWAVSNEEIYYKEFQNLLNTGEIKIKLIYRGPKINLK